MNMRIEFTTCSELAQSEPREDAVVIAMPATDMDLARRSAQFMARRSGEGGLVLVVMDEERQGYIRTCNMAFRQSRGDYFAYVAQDAFAGRLWLRVALKQIESTGKDMLAFNDGKWHGLLASFGMVRRKWAENQYGGDLFFPEYHSHYGDAELTLIARARERLCFAPRSVMIEVDWEKDDKLVNDFDRKLFKRRTSTLFDGKVNSGSDCQIFPSVNLQKSREGDGVVVAI
jgi:hypothetical protein